MDFTELNLYKAEHYSTSESGERERERARRRAETEPSPSSHRTEPDWTGLNRTQQVSVLYVNGGRTYRTFWYLLFCQTGRLFEPECVASDGGSRGSPVGAARLGAARLGVRVAFEWGLKCCMCYCTMCCNVYDKLLYILKKEWGRFHTAGQ